MDKFTRYRYTVLVKIMLTLLDWMDGWDRPAYHLAHMMYILWINGFYNLNVNIILTNLVYRKYIAFLIAMTANES
jgi:hypothetical protein